MPILENGRLLTLRSAERRWIERARANPAFFIEYLTEKPPAAHHILWLREFLDPHHKRTLIVCPREAAKTTISVYFLAWIIGRAPWTTNCISSVSYSQAKERVGMVKEIIEYNPRFQNVFPHIHMDFTKPNTVDQFTVWSERWGDNPHPVDHRTYRSLITKYGEPKNATLFGASTSSSSVIGKRFSGIALVDDPHDAKNVATQDLREKSHAWFDGSFVPTVQETGKIVIVTTRWAETDLAGYVMEKQSVRGEKIWRTIDIPAILPSGESYWPEYWPLPKLYAKREEVGPVMWELMYMNNPLGASSGEFSLDMLRNDLPNPLPEFSSLVIAIDLAVTDKSYSDYTVATALARDQAKPFNVYVLGMIRGKWQFEEVLNNIARFADEIFGEYGRLDRLLFEKQSFQQAWADALKRKRLDLPIEVISLKGDKESRLKAVALKAQGKRLFINQAMPQLAALQSEVIAFPRAQHDDIPDTLSLPFQYWGVADQEAGTIFIKSNYLT